MGAGAGRTCGRRHRRCGRRCGRPGIGRRSRNAASADRRSSPCPRLPTARRVRRCSSVQYSTRQLRNRRTPMAHLDGSSLTLAQLVAVADGRDEAALAAAVLQRIDGARTVVEQHAQGDEPVYGVNTGFGALAETRIAKDALDQLQVNLLRSHAAGVGEPLPVRAVRATMALRANVLAKGFSGIRLETLQRLLDLLNRRVHPIVPSRGSVGASGDLAPLAHLALVLIGEGEARIGDGPVLSGRQALAAAGLQPLRLRAKEGLALINR